jgi:hypothetical protein
MTAFAVTTQGAPLGVVGQEMWVRNERSTRSGRNPGHQPMCGGENVHWLNVLERARHSLSEHAPDTVPWFQLDRGADCWQVLLYAQEADALATIRANHDRKVDAELGTLWATVERERSSARDASRSPRNQRSKSESGTASSSKYAFLLIPRGLRR